jgi:hypothetical protein
MKAASALAQDFILHARPAAATVTVSVSASVSVPSASSIGVSQHRSVAQYQSVLSSLLKGWNQETGNNGSEQ